MTPLILSGGSGTRLWPLSRQQRPKQFLPIINDYTLIQSTLLRLKNYGGLQAPLAICNEAHRFILAEQFRKIGQAHQGILLEPFGRNTAPAVALAALHFQAKGQADEVLLVLPADHSIKDQEAFYAAIRIAHKAATQGDLVTFGVVPESPETGYGYIKTANPEQSIDRESNSRHSAMPIKKFVEKPDLATAEAYLKSGNYLWNSGMFVFRADRYLEELNKFHPEIYQACEAALQNPRPDLDFIRIDPEHFSKNPDISIDYAIMEKTDRATVVPLNAGWNDIGAWSAVWQMGKQDENGNVVRGDAILSESHNNLVFSEKRLVTLLGTEDLIVIDTKDATLVASKDRAQDIKNIVDELKSKERPEATEHKEVERPWGRYESIASGSRFQVKRITVNPGAKLSLQKHHHRAEHWIVVEGTAEVTCDDKVFLLTENQSTYIPLGATHRLSNPGKLPLELIEVQSGSYLEEDDIVRFEDNYGRMET